MRKSGKEVEQFMIYSVELDPTKGAEIKKARPCVHFTYRDERLFTDCYRCATNTHY